MKVSDIYILQVDNTCYIMALPLEFLEIKEAFKARIAGFLGRPQGKVEEEKNKPKRKKRRKVKLE